MCARYIFFEPREIKELAERYDAQIGGGERLGLSLTRLEPSYNIAPGTVNPVVVRRSPKRVTRMKWGLVPFWAKDPRVGWKMINTRAEAIETKPAFRKAIREQRCLIPANGFYEWQRVDLEGKEDKLPWLFRVKDQPVFSFAGIYDVWRDAEGRETESYSLITTEPNEIVGKVHDRMPVILNLQDEDRWLETGAVLGEALKLLKPYSSEKMEGWRVDAKVNKATNDEPGLIEPVNREEEIVNRK